MAYENYPRQPKGTMLPTKKNPLRDALKLQQGAQAEPQGPLPPGPAPQDLNQSTSGQAGSPTPPVTPLSQQGPQPQQDPGQAPLGAGLLPPQGAGADIPTAFSGAGIGTQAIGAPIESEPEPGLPPVTQPTPPPEPSPEEPPPEEPPPITSWDDLTPEQKDLFRGTDYEYTPTTTSTTSDEPPPEDMYTDKGQDNPYVQDYLKSVFGEGRSFDPTAELMQAQLDRGLRRYSEQAASSGMVGAGVEGGAQDIIAGHSRDLAQQYQQFRDQGIQQQMQAASMVLQDDWQKITHEQQKELANLGYELRRNMEFGEGSNPAMGRQQFGIISAALNNPDLSDDSRAMMEGWLEDFYGKDVVAGWTQSIRDTDDFLLGSGYFYTESNLFKAYNRGEISHDELVARTIEQIGIEKWNELREEWDNRKKGP